MKTMNLVYFFSDAGATVVVKWSETMQDRVSSTTIATPLLGAFALCPVRALKVHIGCLESRSNSAIISYSAASQWVTLTDSRARKHLKQVLQMLELPQIYTFHDCRWGGATWFFSRGVPIEQIQMQGTWSSSCVWRYIVLPPIRPFSSGFYFPILSYCFVTSTGFLGPCFASKIYMVQPLHCILITCFPFSISTTSFTYDLTYLTLLCNL